LLDLFLPDGDFDLIRCSRRIRTTAYRNRLGREAMLGFGSNTRIRRDSVHSSMRTNLLRSAHAFFGPCNWMFKNDEKRKRKSTIVKKIDARQA
jgi:hypothetical protein